MSLKIRRMSPLSVVVALGLVALLLWGNGTPSTLAEGEDPPWPMFGYDLQRTGRSPYTGPENPTLKWSFKTGGAVSSSAAIGADGTIYVGSSDNKVYAINPDGSEKWSFATGNTVTSSPAIGTDGTIYVGSGDKLFYAINPDGTQRWSFETLGSIGASPAIGTDGTIYITVYNPDRAIYAINPDGTQKWFLIRQSIGSASPTIGSDGTIYVGSDTLKQQSGTWMDLGQLYALNPEDKSTVWTFNTEGGIIASPAVGSDGTIYFGTRASWVYAVNPDGSQKWKFDTAEAARTVDAKQQTGIRDFNTGKDTYKETERRSYGEKIWSSPGIATDGTIYVGSDNGLLYALNPDGTEKWMFTTDKPISSSPLIDANGTIYVGSHDGNLYALNPDGTEKWIFTTDASISSSVLIDAKGTIYVGSQDGELYAINPDGTEKWSFATGEPIYSSPVLDADGTIYVGSNDNKLYTLADASVITKAEAPVEKQAEAPAAETGGGGCSAALGGARTVDAGLLIMLGLLWPGLVLFKRRQR